MAKAENQESNGMSSVEITIASQASSINQYKKKSYCWV